MGGKEGKRIELVGGKRRGLNWREVELVGGKKRGLNWWEGREEG